MVAIIISMVATMEDLALAKISEDPTMATIMEDSTIVTTMTTAKGQEMVDNEEVKTKS